MSNTSTSDPLSLGKAVNFQIPPTSEVPQSSLDSIANINASRNAQVALNNATRGGRRRRRRSYKGGVGGVGAETIPGDPTTIVVAPLPLGANTPNAQANNVAAASLFANAVTASKYDNAVTQAGGKRRRRTRRLSKKQTRRRSRSRSTSSKKYRKIMKGKKSRRTRRR